MYTAHYTIHCSSDRIGNLSGAFNSIMWIERPGKNIILIKLNECCMVSAGGWTQV